MSAIRARLFEFKRDRDFSRALRYARRCWRDHRRGLPRIGALSASVQDLTLWISGPEDAPTRFGQWMHQVGIRFSIVSVSQLQPPTTIRDRL